MSTPAYITERAALEVIETIALGVEDSQFARLVVWIIREMVDTRLDEKSAADAAGAIRHLVHDGDLDFVVKGFDPEGELS